MGGLSRRLLTTTIMGGLAMLPAVPAHALPVGGQVSGGQATIATGTGQTVITQSSPRAVIDWKGFNVGSDESVRFNQPSSSSITLNRVNSVNPSAIDGTVTANGQVWLINPQGIAFGKNAQVNVAGLLATTSDIADADFMNGDYNFTHLGNATATISNAGSLTALSGGLIALAGPNVSNTGIITARLGKVQLASGDSFTVDLYGDGLINLQASPAITQQLVANSGTIAADGGQVLLTAAAAETVLNSLINMSGLVEADYVGSRQGEVTIYAAGNNAVPGNVAADKGKLQGGSEVLVSGTISVAGKGAGQTGGNVTVTGDNVDLASGSMIDASGNAGGGYVKIGGDFHGQGTTPTALTTVLETGAVIDASAITTGDGGKVAVWSDRETDFGGSILATGGAVSGNGGYVETSGHTLYALGTVDAGAAHGNAGTWLLDPYDVTIAAGSGTNTSVTCSGTPQTCTPSGNATIYAANIDSTLSGGTSVTISTGSSGSSNGDIFVNGSISESYSGPVSLTLQAYRDITLAGNVSIASTGGPLNVTLDSATGGGEGYIYLNSGAGITSGGGNITLGGGSNPLTMPAVGAQFVEAIQFNGNNTLNAGTGNISMLADGYGIQATGGNDLIETTTGNILMRADASLGGASEFILDLEKGTTVTTSTGNITLVGTTKNVLNSQNAIGILTGGGSESGTTVISSTGTGPNVGTITLTGTAYANGGSFSFGLSGYNNISSVDGNIVLNGTTTSTALYTPASGYDIGINMGGNITSTGNGTIYINGTGDYNNSNNNWGILLNTMNISAHNGAINLIGTAGGLGTGNYGVYGGGGNTIVSTGTAPITITGIGSGGAAGIYSGGYTIGGASTHGNITLIADSLNLNGNPVQTSGNLQIEPYTSGTTMGVGTGTGTLSLSDALLGTLTYSSLTIGGSNAGAMDIHTGVTFADPVTFQTGGGANITLDAPLASSAGGTAFTLASGGNFVNTAGASAFDLTGGGRWLIYSANPADNTLDGLTAGFDRYSCTYGGSCPSFPATGNGLLYSTTPELTITPNALGVTYGQAAPATDGYTVSGYLTAADLASIGFSGAIGLSTPYALGSSVGTYNITATAGTLADALGYGFTFATRTGGLTVGQKILTVTALDQSKTYGTADPALTYDYSGLAGGDTASVFSGSLSRASGQNVGTYAITQGTLSAGANYAISFTGGRLTINPATLYVMAENQSKTYGTVNPPLTFTYSGLANGDTGRVLLGDLTTGAAFTSPVGSYAISQGSLSAGSNYAINFTGGTLTVTPLANNNQSMSTVIMTLGQANNLIDPAMVTVKNAEPITLIYLGYADGVPSEAPSAGCSGTPPTRTPTRPPPSFLAEEAMPAVCAENSVQGTRQ